MKLHNKVAVVSGASDGIGKRIALALAREGVLLALVARSQEKLADTSAQALKLGAPHVVAYSCDLRVEKNISETVKKILSDFPSVHILINCAGVWQKTSKLEEIGAATIQEVIQANLVGLIQLTKMFLPTLKKQKEAAIVNISSRSGYKAQENQSVYTASKWGVTGFTEVLKVELKNTPIRVAGVYQGGVNTDMFKKVGDVFDQSKLIRPEDLAEVVVFMLSRPPQIWLHDVRVEY